MATVGTLYFITNPSMPGLVKIGHTTGSLKTRLRQLSSTGVPNPFEVVATFSVQNPRECEAGVHQRLNGYRSNPKREFFAAGVDVLLRESIEVIGPFLEGASLYSNNSEHYNEFTPDKDDIYFMFYLLHDCYQKGTSYSSKDLAIYHDAYSPIELDLKLMKLEVHGFVKRVNPSHEGLGRWAILPKGLKFMIENNHHDQVLLKESKNET